MNALKKAFFFAAVCAAALVLRQAFSGPGAVRNDSKKPADTGTPPQQAAGLAQSGPPAQERVFVSIPAPNPLSSNRPIELFQGGKETKTPWTLRTPAAHRSRTVFPDPSWMTPDPVLKKGDSILLELFDDAVFEARIHRVTRYSNGAVGITARLSGEPGGFVYLSYFEEKVSASVEAAGGSDYAVKYANGVHYALEINYAASDLLEGGEPLVPVRQTTALQKRLVRDAPVPSGDAPVRQPVYAGQSPDVVTVDVMILYTPAAKSWAAGANGSIENVVALAMERSNEAHFNSDTRIELNLVYSGEVDYTESGSSGTDLNRLTEPSDGYLDEVHLLRDEYSADLVCLFTKMEDTGGLTWQLIYRGLLPHSREEAFSVVRVQQADQVYTLVHEWAHNMGAHHHKEQNVQPGPADWEDWPENTWSAGWRWTGLNSLRYCSVMTYEAGKYFSDDLDHTRVPYFSNPDINHQGVPSGDSADGDNARTIRELRHMIADYRINPSISQFPYSNSFELGFIDWSYDGAEALWEREDGTDPNLITAVSSGWGGTTNAADGDIFLFINAEENKTARLDTVCDFRYLETAEFRFSYHMYSYQSGQMGSLSLLVSTNGASWNPVWQKSGSQGDEWKTETVDLSAYAGLPEVFLRWEAEAGSTWAYTYMMLDDFYITGTLNPDLDNDGIPNWWEELYFGGPTNANAQAMAANQVNTVLETYIAGLDPHDPGSFFRITETETVPGPPPSNVIRWDSQTGRVYSVYWTADLRDEFQLLTNQIPSTQPSFTDTVHSAESSGFYQLRVQVEE